MTQQGYEAAVLRLARELQAAALEPGALIRVTVAHDSWCAKLRGGRCDCEPIVSVGEMWPAGDAPVPRRSANGR
jgi:hypothetical protein